MTNLKTQIKTEIYDGVKGEIITDAPIGEQSWFRCGGNADLLFKPADAGDLAHFLRSQLTTHNSPLTIIGGLANTIVRDGGVSGVTIQLGKSFSDIQMHDDGATFTVGCGALNGSIAAAAVKAGIGGFEFLSGIPGSLGGALRMNAGAYGAQIQDILVEIHALDFAGNKYVLRQRPMDKDGIAYDCEAMEINLSYRNNDAPHYLIFTAAVLKGARDTYENVKSRITEIKAKRNETQPIKEKTGGSTFANPTRQALRMAGLPEDMRAWQIVEKIGGRGLSIGGAQMSEKHCNFMINTGQATADDLETLGDELISRAKHQLGIELHWEIKRIGESN